jgi:hypothetical protein
MDFEEYLKELNADKDIIFRLQNKYYTLMCNHMRLKKSQRGESWDKARSMLFHIQGALAMLANGVRSYIK